MKNKKALFNRFIIFLKKLFFLNKQKHFKLITATEYLWDNKPIKEKSVLLWDLENIPFNRLNDIKRLAKYTPEELYVVTTAPISMKQRVLIEKNQFKILDAHKTIADDKIIAIMKLYTNRANMILISSDSDFVQEVTNYIISNKLHWIVTDAVKKAIVMRVNISNPNLTISTLSKKHYSPSQLKQRKKHQQKHKSIGWEERLKKDTQELDAIIKSIAPDRETLYGVCKCYAPTNLLKLLDSYKNHDIQYTFTIDQHNSDATYRYLRFAYNLLYKELGDDSFIIYLSKAALAKLDRARVRKKYKPRELIETIKAYKNLQSASLIQLSTSTNIQIVYRLNAKQKRVECAKIQIYSQKNKALFLRKNLSKKYKMPPFTKKIDFSDDAEINNFVNYNIEEGSWYLNEFERML